MPSDIVSGGTGGDIVSISVASGAELGYAEHTVDTGSLTNTTYADLANLSSVAFTVETRPVRVEFFTPLVQVGSATAVFGARIVDSTGVTVYASTEYFPGAAFAEGPLTLSRRFSTPGSYVVKVQTRTTTSNYAIKSATYSTPTYLTAVAL